MTKVIETIEVIKGEPSFGLHKRQWKSKNTSKEFSGKVNDLGHMINTNYGNRQGSGKLYNVHPDTGLFTEQYNGLRQPNLLESCRIVSDYTTLLLKYQMLRQHSGKCSVWGDKDQQWQTIDVCRFVGTQSSITLLWY